MLSKIESTQDACLLLSAWSSAGFLNHVLVMFYLRGLQLHILWKGLLIIWHDEPPNCMMRLD
jgi:hypothetical protein